MAMLRIGAWALALVTGCWASCALAAVQAVDDRGLTIRLERPAQRIVSLGPHVTELLFAAGGGARIVGALEYSDHPPEARRIPRMGDNRALDHERIAAARPDLVVVWWHGIAQRQVDALRRLGVPVFHSEPKDFETIATSVERLGVLLGTRPEANAQAAAFRAEMTRLRERYAARPPVSVFYQVWERPLMTLNDAHIVSAVIRLCGGRNVFADLSALAPAVSREAVLQRDPEVLLASDAGATPDSSGTPSGLQALAVWKGFPQMTAVARGNLFAVDGDRLNRGTPRVAQAADTICQALETARARRPR
jgi:iron complex transport system substrate-binding protein